MTKEQFAAGVDRRGAWMRKADREARLLGEFFGYGRDRYAAYGYSRAASDGKWHRSKDVKVWRGYPISKGE
jgi:hypothetical protein